MKIPKTKTIISWCIRIGVIVLILLTIDGTLDIRDSIWGFIIITLAYPIFILVTRWKEVTGLYKHLLFMIMKLLTGKEYSWSEPRWKKKKH